jgi:cyclopropane fatty-acyl-phospholipid synthase-like methyltransferase
MKTDKFGSWQGVDSENKHAYDPKLCDALVNFFTENKCSTLIDVGCGKGDYVKELVKENIKAVGFDGNKETPLLSNNKCKVFDFSKDCEALGVYDWVLSLEVGEHLPPCYENIFINNLHKLNKKGIVLSWAVEGQKGFGHFNCRNNDYIKNKFISMGYENIIEQEEKLRNSSTKPWFKNTIMVFRKK